MINKRKRIQIKFYKFDKRLSVLIAPLLLLLIPLLTGKVLFWGVPALQFIPWETFAWDNLLNGIFPFWNNLNGMGTPLFANYQLALLYPPNWVSFPFYALGGVGWLAWSKNILLILHLVWAGAGMLKLMERLGFDHFSQSVSGLSFQLCAYLVTRLGFFSMIWAAAWIPWVLYTASDISFPGDRDKRPRKVIVLPFLLCLVLQLLAGHAQLTWYTLVFSGFWVLTGGWTISRYKGAIKAFMSFSVNVLVAVLLTAVQLLPTAELLLLSQRSSAVGFETAMTYSFWPWRLLTLLAPNLFGSPAAGDYWGYASYWEDAIYLGIIPLLMVLITLKRLIKKKSNQRILLIFLWVFSGISILFALGKNTPVFPLLYKYIPTFDMFNAPARFLIWLEISFAILAGIGVVYWKKPEGKGLYWLRLGTAGGFAVTLGAFLTLFTVGDVKTTFIRATALTGFWLVGAGVLTLTKPKPENKKRTHSWQSLVLLWIFLDLFTAGYMFNPFVDMEFYTADIPDHVELVSDLDGHRVFLSSEDEYQIKFKRFLRFTDFQAEEPWINLRYTLVPNSNIFESISSANNFDPLLPAYYADFFERVNLSDGNEKLDYLSLMDVGVYEERNKNMQYGISWKKLPQAERIRWYSCAFLTNSQETAREKLLSILSTEGEINKWLVLESFGASNQEICYDEGDFAFELLEDDPDRLRLDVSISNEGWLMVSDTWYPGWKVYIDGKPASILKADTVFKGVQLTSGQHTIEFVYKPVIFYVGLGLSLFSSLLLGLIIKRKRNESQQIP